MSQSSSISTILLAYQRHGELVQDEHLFSGSVQLLDAEGSALFQRGFSEVPFHGMMTEVSRDLRETRDAQVVLQRTERPGIPAMPLSEELRVLLRDDPVAAIAAMNIKVGAKAGGSVVRQTPSEFDEVAEVFNTRVFIRMRNGMFEDPLTGTWRPIAYSESKKAWLIRADNNKSDSWLRVMVPSFSGTDVTESMDQVGEELAKSCWATVSVEELLERNVNKYFLPRLWNTGGQWISRTELRELLDAHNNQKEMKS